MLRKLNYLVGITGVLVGLMHPNIAAGENTGISQDGVFLNEVASAQKAEIALGRMATERAESEKTKEFGARMIEDHQKAEREVTQLAAEAAVQPPGRMPAVHTEKAQHIAQLTGKDFDRTYITYMLKDHIKDITEFERASKELSHPQNRQWAAATLPVLKEHLKMAKSVADELGIELETVRQ
jgi:putative membrane protein